jgi:hypothetical protein
MSVICRDSPCSRIISHSKEYYKWWQLWGYRYLMAEFQGKKDRQNSKERKLGKTNKRTKE